MAEINKSLDIANAISFIGVKYWRHGNLRSACKDLFITGNKVIRLYQVKLTDEIQIPSLDTLTLR